MIFNDWVRLHRKLLDSRVFTDETTLKLWIWCLLRANWKARAFDGETIPAGSFVTGRVTGSEECGMSQSKWYRGMQKLVAMDMIVIKSNSKWTMVSVMQWATYQASKSSQRTADEQRLNSQRTADEQRLNTIEEGLEGLEGKESKECRCGFADDGSFILPAPKGKSQFRLKPTTIDGYREKFPRMDVRACLTAAVNWYAVRVDEVNQGVSKIDDLRPPGVFIHGWLVRAEKAGEHRKADVVQAYVPLTEEQIRATMIPGKF